MGVLPSLQQYLVDPGTWQDVQEAEKEHKLSAPVRNVTFSTIVLQLNTFCNEFKPMSVFIEEIVY